MVAALAAAAALCLSEVVLRFDGDFSCRGSSRGGAAGGVATAEVDPSGLVAASVAGVSVARGAAAGGVATAEVDPSGLAAASAAGVSVTCGGLPAACVPRQSSSSSESQPLAVSPPAAAVAAGTVSVAAVGASPAFVASTCLGDATSGEGAVVGALSVEGGEGEGAGAGAGADSSLPGKGAATVVPAALGTSGPCRWLTDTSPGAGRISAVFAPTLGPSSSTQTFASRPGARGGVEGVEGRSAGGVACRCRVGP